MIAISRVWAERNPSSEGSMRKVPDSRARPAEGRTMSGAASSTGAPLNKAAGGTRNTSVSGLVMA